MLFLGQLDYPNIHGSEYIELLAESMSTCPIRGAVFITTSGDTDISA